MPKQWANRAAIKFEPPEILYFTCLKIEYPQPLLFTLKWLYFTPKRLHFTPKLLYFTLKFCISRSNSVFHSRMDFPEVGGWGVK
jgi:hypothetical protein